MTKPRPSVFIGSSAEGLEIAEAIQLNLDYACQVTIWHQGVFGLGQGTLESLVERLSDFDFAVLVLTPDDVTLSRESLEQSPRDNVLLELGLFIGALGRDRSFIVYDREKDLKLPSDLAGVTPATYQEHEDGNLQASLGAATTLLKGSIQRLGKRVEKITANVDENTQFQIIHDLLDNAPEQFLIWMHETDSSLVRESKLFGPSIRYEFSLKNQAGGSGGFSIDELCDKLPDAGLLQINLRNVVTLTERGKAFGQWLIDNGHKADFFRSDVCQWGEPPKGAGRHWPFPGMERPPWVPPATEADTDGDEKPVQDDTNGEGEQ
tara:strand:+ start:100 stop:1062 length:963 start_codon:yes stop_codon:yes gene_type:complete